jgi:hypothetical protein
LQKIAPRRKNQLYGIWPPLENYLRHRKDSGFIQSLDVGCGAGGKLSKMDKNIYEAACLYEKLYVIVTCRTEGLSEMVTF